MNENLEKLAIDTHYDGYHFRSRTEARWAVLFNHIGWKYLYEDEGYNLPSGPYLPDFYFPEINVFAEVKPNILTQLEFQKCVELSELMDRNDHGISMLLLEGVPSHNTLRTISGGRLFVNVIMMDKNSFRYPFFQSDEFDKNIMYIDKTIDAIRKAKEARFEFEWKEKQHG